MFDPKTTVLIPIDMQQAFDGPPWPQRWNDRVDENGRALLAAFREGFEPLDGETVVSNGVNAAFIGTDLDLRLRRLGATRIVLFGISTDMCVSTSVRVGSNLGWKVTLVEDACDCFDLPDGRGGTAKARDVHRAHVATLGFEFAEVVRTVEAVGGISAA